ncbi:hypothetical protein DNTS_017658 [Danionella cerebrum]|uniref:VWFC domain-containing protein n=1 Tax=Danionella cerebrum TaxID=2873325 RepID=A0A553MXE6_9TELE|nr:hypothetical protein DNTS_017658 [Danionella translucida]
MELKCLHGEFFLALFVLLEVCGCVQSHEDANPAAVIDLLKALNITHLTHGIYKAKGRDPETPAWRFRSSTPHLILPYDVSKQFFTTSQGVLGLYLEGLQKRRSVATLVSFIYPGQDERPLLELISDTKGDQLKMEFRSADGSTPEVLVIPGGSPFTGGAWVRLALSVEPRQVVMFLECQEPVVMKLKGGERILQLDFTQDLQVTFSSSARKKANKFSGIWQTAELSMRRYEGRPWVCGNQTDNISPTKVSSPTVMDLGMMQDEAYRGDGVLSTVSPSELDRHHGQVERNLHSILTMLDMLKEQNSQLQTRVEHLETCECRKRKCVLDGGTEVEEGTRWSPDAQTMCLCTNGQVHCNRSNECRFHSNIYNNGEVFSPDDCSRCTCEDASMKEKPMRVVNGSCRDQIHVSTASAQYHVTPLSVCQHCAQTPTEGLENAAPPALSGNQDCVDVHACPTTCQDGPKPPYGSCCRDCSRCNFHGMVVLDGVSFQDTHDSCKQCVCRAGNVECTPQSCPQLPCQLLESVGGQCCPRKVKSTVKVNAAMFPAETQPLHLLDPVVLSAMNGNIQCERFPCPPAPCNNPVIPPGECCARCEECVYEGEVFLDGQTFSSRHDPCLRCQCSSGRVSCDPSRSSCLPPDCTHPAKPANQCWCGYEGRVYEDGEEFRPPGGGPCIQCTCKHCGRCQYGEHVYEHGQRFTDPQDPCVTCTCQDGQTTCGVSGCPEVTCANPFTPPGECCPRCPVQDCEYENRIISNGDSFPNPGNPCLDCVCNDGRVDCGNHECPKPSCNHPRPGTCCQNNCNDDAQSSIVLIQSFIRENVAPNAQVTQLLCCLYNGNEHANGARFEDTVDLCVTCVCRDGTVTCRPSQCPKIDCPYPVMDRCCPNCKGCMFAGVEYLNGQEFPDPADPCSHCICSNGHVTCNRKPCQHPGCSNPITQPGQCCPACDGCQFEGRVYLDGQSFSSPVAPCEECRCFRGEVECSPRICAQVSCLHPGHDRCFCPVCDSCLFNDRDCSNGETFHDPRDPCRSCKCLVSNRQQ